MLSFDFIQVEVTRRCSASCIMCPSKCWKSDRAKNIDMSFETFEVLSKYFKHSNRVHLQGWGEPLLHDRFFEMLEIASKASKVSFTTNGMHIAENVEEILNHEVDTIAVSIAGATKETHERIRRGTNFDKVIEGVKLLSRMREKSGNDKPRIVLTFLMNRYNIHELPALVDLSSGLADYLIVTNLDYVFDEETDRLKVFGNPEKEHLNLIREAKKKAKKKGVKIRVSPLELEEVVVCAENPISSFTVSAEGNIYPCVFLSLPFDRIPRVFCGKRVEVEKPNFGNVMNFEESWNSESYVNFRRMYEKRLEAYKRVMDAILAYPFSYWRSPIESVLEKNPLPDICKTCYKAYGIDF
jgi:MoaA/NifB/PqqE/SkfB family radical SAM enzyme